MNKEAKSNAYFNKLEYLSFEVNSSKVFTPLTHITKESVMKNSECLMTFFNILQEIVGNEKDMKAISFFTLTSQVYTTIESRFYDKPDYVNMLFKRFQTFIDTILLNTKITKDNSTFITLSEYEDSENADALKIQILFFFLMLFTFYNTKKTPTMRYFSFIEWMGSEEDLKEESGVEQEANPLKNVYILSCKPSEFITCKNAS